MSNFTHHAYFLTGPTSLRPTLISILEKEYKLTARGNPDFFDQSFDTFTIDDARELKRLHSMRPIGQGGKKIFLVSMNGITVEAQNALLKLFEEPAEYAHFFIVIPSAHILLPTVKSRMQEFQVSKEVTKPGNKKDAGNLAGINSEVLKTAQKLVTLSKAKRLEEVKKLADEISKDKKTKQDAIELLNALQAIIYDERGVKEGKSALEAIEFARSYMHDRAPSVKMLLEYVMLSM